MRINGVSHHLAAHQAENVARTASSRLPAGRQGAENGGWF